MMKKNIITYILVSFLGFNFLWTQQSSAARKVENSVQRQLEGYLSQALPANTYLITTSARVKVIRKAVPQKSQLELPVTPPTSEDYLPGLEPLGNNLNPNNLPNSSSLDNALDSLNSLNFRTDNRRYEYQDQEEIEALTVQIILDESLDGNLTSVVKKTIGDKVTVAYGDVSSVIFSTANILGARTQVAQPPQQPVPVATAPVVKDFDFYLDKYSYILYILFAGFIFFFMLAVFFFFIWLFLKMLARKQEEEREIDLMRKNVTPIPRRKAKRPSYPPTVLPPYYYPSYPPYPYGGGYPDPRMMIPPNAQEGAWNNNMGQRNDAQEKSTPSKKKELTPPNDDDVQREVKSAQPVDPPVSYEQLRQSSVDKETKFLENFLNDPLVARNFFFNLDDEDQKELMGAFPKPSTRKIFNRLNPDLEVDKNSKLDDVEDLMQKEKIRHAIFDKYTEALEQHQKILSDQTKDVFGKISLLTGDEMDIIFATLDVKLIADSYQVIESSLIYKYLEKLPDQKKNEFIKVVQEEKPLSEEEVKKLRQIYSSRLDTIARNMFISKTNKYELQEKVFLTVKDKKIFLENIKSTDPEFYEANKKYTIDFNDFMEAKDSEFRSQFERTIEDEDNEVIATAFANLVGGERDEILLALAGERQTFVRELMLPKVGQVTKEEEDEARDLILERYRSIAFR